MRLRRLLLILMVAMTGCAVTTPADLGWTQDAPDFRMTKLEWNVVDGQQNLRHLCGLGNAWNGKACAIRIREGGLCVVFSVLSEQQAKDYYLVYEGWSLWAHESAHCQGWGHN
jgi:hypothetical protein